MQLKHLAILLLLVLISACPASGKVIYVDDDATGANDGTTWQDGYVWLQRALSAAHPGDEIRVAQGRYRATARSGLFIVYDLSLEGGYAGFGHPDPNSRDIARYEAVLSGDFEGNDVQVTDPCNLLSEPTRVDNCYHVITAGSIAHSRDTRITLGGFSISGGNTLDGKGGGVLCTRVSLTLIECTFRDNSALCGGAIYNEDGNLILTRCLFIGNAAATGGAIYNSGYWANVEIRGCKFTDNVSVRTTGLLPWWWGNRTFLGGAVCTYGGSSLSLDNCVFSMNAAVVGGAVGADKASLVITDCNFVSNRAKYAGAVSFDSGWQLHVTGCRFLQNEATEHAGAAFIIFAPDGSVIRNSSFHHNRAQSNGGAIVLDQSVLTLDRCTLTANLAQLGGAVLRVGGELTVNRSVFAGNSARETGGAILNAIFSVVTVLSSSFVGNKAQQGGGMFLASPSSATIRDCILWNDEGHDISVHSSGASVVASYSDVRCGWPGMGNIAADPCFVDPGYWNRNGTPEDANDDFWVDGDYHLKSQAGRWDTKTQSWVNDDVTSPCIDTGDPMSPIGHEPFPNGGRINMGAYGGTAEASKSYFGNAVCETIVAGDINGDCKVDLADFAIMALHWLEEPLAQPWQENPKR